MSRVLMALVVAASLAGCRGQPAPPAPRAEGSEVPVASPAPDGSIPVGEFGAYVQREEPEWRRSPLRSSLEFVGHDQPEATVTTLTERTDYLEGAGPATVVLTHSGLGDDSVRAVRYVLRFESREDGTWRLVSARWAQRCAPGRGHQRFSLEPCI